MKKGLNMSDTVIISDLPSEPTKRLTGLVFECLRESLAQVEKVTTVNQEFPHKLDASIEWIRLCVRKNNPLMPGVCSIKINSTLHVMSGNEKKTVPGFCESFQFDLSEVSKEDIEGDLWDSVVKTIRQVHMVTLSQAMKGK